MNRTEDQRVAIRCVTVASSHLPPGALSVRKPRAASCVSVPGPKTQAWSVSWFILILPAAVISLMSLSSILATRAGGNGPGKYVFSVGSR